MNAERVTELRTKAETLRFGITGIAQEVEQKWIGPDQFEASMFTLRGLAAELHEGLADLELDSLDRVIEDAEEVK